MLTFLCPHPTRLQLSVSLSTTPPQSLELQLFDSIDSANSSYKVFSTKVDVVLKKANPGVRWTTLEAAVGDAAPPSYDNATAGPSSSASATTTTSAIPPAPFPAPSSSSRPRSKWDNLQLDDGEDDDAEAKNTEARSAGGVDAFFQKLYADADDDTKRAMMKSYSESGGTSLSTNWAEVGKGEVRARPPDGMEARKW